MKTPTTKAEAMNEARQAKERAVMYEARAKKAPKVTAGVLKSLAKDNRARHASMLALAASLA